MPTVRPAATGVFATGTTLLLSRALRAAKLDRTLYEEVEADRTATGQAVVIVAFGALAAAIGAAPTVSVPGGLGIVGSVVAGLLGWAAYAAAAYVVGGTVLRGRDTKTDWGELARTLGFASAPRALLILGQSLEAIVALWVLATTLLAIRAALDVSTRRTIVVAIVAWLVFVLVQGLAGAFIRGLSFGALTL
ncbi:MAG TPA: YIP1 family protein [Candidatus Limnocylindria bacterium]|nr:YIP1 family protein [Candidatus Limnocylindria bacterium]